VEAVVKRSTWIALLAIVLALAACVTAPPPGPPRTFANVAPIAIPEEGATTGPAAPYPSTIEVEGLPSEMPTFRVRLNRWSHAWPGDVEVLLVAPGGAHALLFSDAGGSTDAADVTLIFEASATDVLPPNGPIVSGAFLPSVYGDGGAFPAPAPVGPYVADLNAFADTDPNGTWSLFVVDDQTGDVGALAGGWSLTFFDD
jgi:subtilisin-like proprotein convertase family protein